MPKITAVRIRARMRPEGKHRPLPAGAFIALQLVAWASLALFVMLYREPLPDELLAAYAARWVVVGQTVN